VSYTYKLSCIYQRGLFTCLAWSTTVSTNKWTTLQNGFAPGDSLFPLSYLLVDTTPARARLSCEKLRTRVSLPGNMLIFRSRWACRTM